MEGPIQAGLASWLSDRGSLFMFLALSQVQPGSPRCLKLEGGKARGSRACLPARSREVLHYFGIFVSWVFFFYTLPGIELSLCSAGIRLAWEGGAQGLLYFFFIFFFNSQEEN